MNLQPHSSWDITDSTKLQDYMRCPRRYFFSHVLGWRQEDPSIHLVFGSAMHKALDIILTDGFNIGAIEHGYDAFLKEYRETFSEASDEANAPKEPAQVLPALAAYVKRYKDLDTFKVLYTEIAGSVPIGDNMTLHFIIDAICQDDMGIFDLDHKTTSGYFRKVWAMQFNLSVQVGTYIHALYCMYSSDDVWGALINGMCFAKTKPVEFMRVPVQRTNQAMQNWLDMVKTHMFQMQHDFEVLLTEDSADNISMKSFPQKPTACGDFGGCPFHAYCIAWPNPLKHVNTPPIGMKVEYWDPRDKEKDAKEVMHL